MAADFNKPTAISDNADYSGEIRDNVDAVAKMSFSGASNVPTGALAIEAYKANQTTARSLKKYNGSTWDDVSFIPPGVIQMFGGASAPTGYLLCNGGEYSQTDYSALYAAIGTTFNIGGETAGYFRVPDLQQRFPIGKAASGTGSTLGGTGGEIDHDHTITHTHDLSNHTHDLQNHTHGLGSHTHSMQSHSHEVPAHKHDSRAPGATIGVNTASGYHTHEIEAQYTGSTAHDHTGNSEVAIGPGSGLAASPNPNTNTASHDHVNTTFSGHVGPSAGSSGDAAFNTGAPSTASTGAAAGNTDTPSSNTTGYPSSNATGAVSTSDSGTNNPPFIAVNFIIKT